MQLALGTPSVATRLSVKRPASEPPRSADDGSDVAGDESLSESPGAGFVDSDVAKWVREDAEGEESAAGEEAPVTEFVAELLGAEAKHVAGRLERGHSYSDRLSVRCTNPFHPTCGRSRSKTLHLAELGPHAAQWFLGAWLEKAHLPEARHRGFTPTLSDARAFKARFELGAA